MYYEGTNVPFVITRSTTDCRPSQSFCFD